MLETSQLAKLFGTLSRYANDGDAQFLKIKESVAKILEGRLQSLTVSDMLHWSLPLAAEEIKNTQIWDRFKHLMLSNPDSLSF